MAFSGFIKARERPQSWGGKTTGGTRGKRENEQTQGNKKTEKKRPGEGRSENKQRKKKEEESIDQPMH